jgi:hypothetical protein
VIPLAALWLPILVSAIFVFLVSSVMHTVLTYHSRDYIALPNEDAVRAAIQSGSPAAREYIIPYCANMQAMKTPEMRQKLAEGPVGRLTLREPGPYTMRASLLQWFAYLLVISALVAALASHTIPPGAGARRIFHVIALATWLGYAGAHVSDSIWFSRPWSITLKHVFDGLIYGLVTAATFVWLWPR